MVAGVTVPSELVAVGCAYLLTLWSFLRLCRVWFAERSQQQNLDGFLADACNHLVEHVKAFDTVLNNWVLPCP